MDKVKFKFHEEKHSIELNEDIQSALEVLNQTDQSIFITGKAGTGKSMLLKYLISQSKKEMAVLSYTGLAALNIRGQTIHSFFRLPLGFINTSSISKNDAISEVMQNVDTIIIDEVSMVRADLMDGINVVLQKNRENSLPFGGVQMLLVGDLSQLPPIVDNKLKEHFNQIYQSPYFFDAQVFKQIKVPYLNLKKIYRQPDDAFKKMLNNIRQRKNIADTLSELNKRQRYKVKNDDGYIYLTSTNSQADEVNFNRLKALRGREKKYEVAVDGNANDKENNQNSSIKLLSLKKGAKVMFIKNDREGRWVNGDLGEVIKLRKNSIIVKKGEEEYEVKRETWDKIDYTYVPGKNGKRGRIEERVVGTIEQFPLKLAWAMTIHKSQGQTFDKVILDLGNGAFSHGQTYVALSRCRSLENLVLKQPVKQKDIILDARIYDFEQVLYPFSKEIGPRHIEPKLASDAVSSVFIETNKIIYHINETIIKEAEKEIILISPFIQLSIDNIVALLDVDPEKVATTIVYGKSDLDITNSELLRIIDPERLLYSHHLHAKIYLNEKTALFTSMNLYDASQSNIELGLLINKENDPDNYSKLRQFAMGIINNSTKRHIADDRIEAEFIDDEYITIEDNSNGHCIRCGDSIRQDSDLYYTMCNECYSEWNQYANEDYEECFCHACGEPAPTSKAEPLCMECEGEEI